MFRIQQLLERALAPYTLLIINLAIIFSAETVGQSRLFYDSGLIHGIAILFIMLAGVRIFQRYYLFDPEIRNLLRMSLWAMTFFALSHIVEFASFEIFHTYADAAFANVINFYCISLIFMYIGTERVMAIYEGRSSRRIHAAGVAIAVFLLLTGLYLAKNSLISLEPDEAAPYAYAAVVLSIGSYSLYRLVLISRLYPLLKPFAKYLVQATVLIILATMPNIFYEHLEALGLEKFQVIYLSHFTFYAALSVMFLAYGESLKIGGIHKEIREAAERGDIEEPPAGV